MGSVFTETSLEFYAHSKGAAPPADWQPLVQHLNNVADLAAEGRDI
jgi:hypothetical protein